LLQLTTTLIKSGGFMEKLVTLNINGEFDKGFVVQAEVRQDAGTAKHPVSLSLVGVSAKLSAHPERLEQ
jgi:hypothetical protein